MGSSPFWERLYRFNTAPEPLGRSASGEVATGFLPATARLDGGTWTLSREDDPHWVFLRQSRLHASSAALRRRNGFFKLYVSPAVADFRNGVEATLRAAAIDCAVMKFARTPGGICRPDKIVVYTDSLTHTRRVAARLAAAVTGLRPHGVPFTARVDNVGLLSWAIDPSCAQRRFASWRVWICHMIVQNLGAARSHSDPFLRVQAVKDALVERHGLASHSWRLRLPFCSGF